MNWVIFLNAAMWHAAGKKTRRAVKAGQQQITTEIAERPVLTALRKSVLVLSIGSGPCVDL